MELHFGMAKISSETEPDSIENLRKRAQQGGLWITSGEDEDHSECMTEAPGGFLKNADFHGKDLSFSDFHDANLEGANLSHCDLSKTDFTNADLRGANLTGADLRGASFVGAKLRGVLLKDAIIDAETELPDDFSLEG